MSLRTSRASRLPAVLPLAALLSAAALSGAEPGATPAAPRNSLLLITAEGLRPDRIGFSGRTGAARTPEIDALAKRSVYFEQVLAPSPSALPSLATILTGLYPQGHQVWDDDARNRLDADRQTLAERLKQAGWRTAAFVGTSRLAAERGFDQGFDLFQDGYRPPASGVWRLALRTGDQLLPAAKSWLEGTGETPFFLWVHFIEPTVPVQATLNEPTKGAEEGYRQRLGELDRQVGELLRTLEERKLAPRTHVILTAPHGFGLTQHGELRSGVFLYDTTLRVPLIVQVAGGAGTPRRERGLAGLVDLRPTLERLLGLPPAPGLPGRDLLGASPAEGPAYYAVALMGREVFGWRPFELVARGEHRLITGVRDELYDVAADPVQKKNLAAARSGEIRKLQALRTAITGRTRLPAPRWEGEGSIPPDLGAKLSAKGFVAPGAADAARDPLPDPDRFRSILPSLEIAAVSYQIRGPLVLAPLEARVEAGDPDGYFTLLALSELGFLRAEPGRRDLENAARRLQRAQRLFPRDSQVYHFLSHLASAEKRFADAELYLKVAAALGARFPGEVAYDLACAYSRQEKKELALEELRRSIRLGFRDAAHIQADPDLEPVRTEPSFERLMEEEFPSLSKR
jgi:arylsulfatase A-like enzyme